MVGVNIALSTYKPAYLARCVPLRFSFSSIGRIRKKKKKRKKKKNSQKKYFSGEV
jgi:hypothetical protein